MPKKPKKPTTPKKKRRSTVTAPTRPTVKRLFALSGNRCAFKKCTTPIVDTRSDSILGEICHIRGEKPNAKRYDDTQNSVERHGFDNLILLCPAHHKIIDDDEETHTVEVLTDLKRRHEKRQRPVEATDQVANKLIQNFSKYAVKRGSVIKSSRQTGGQVAHSIKNIYNSPTADDRLQIEGTIGPIADLKTLKQFGSAGVQLTVVNRGARPAKIARAQFCVQGKGFLAALERGFAEDLKHNPPVGHENERLFVNMFPRAKKQCSDGFVLQRDDVCRFFLPFGPYIGPALKAKQDDVFFRVVYFDGSKEILVRGKEAQDVIRSTVEAYGDWPHKPRRTLNFGIEVTSTELPKLDFGLIGKANPNSLWFGKPGTEPKPPEDIQLEVELGIAGIKNDWTIILTMRKLPKKAMERLKAAFCVVEEAEKAIYVQELARIAAHRGETEAAFVIPVEHRDKAIRVVRTFRPELFWIGIFIDRTELIRISSDKLKQVFEALEQHLNTQDQAKQEKS